MIRIFPKKSQKFVKLACGLRLRYSRIPLSDLARSFICSSRIWHVQFSPLFVPFVFLCLLFLDIYRLPSFFTSIYLLYFPFYKTAYCRELC